MVIHRNPVVVAIIQARMDSSRLPGKVLLDIGGMPMLFHVVVRARRAQTLGKVIVATTTDESDDPIAQFCQARGFPFFRGHPRDVLDRYYQSALFFGAETIVRLTADCPMIDPGEIDRTVHAFFEAKVDFAANRLPPPWKRTTPIGQDTEVVTFDALAEAWRDAKAKYAREHVMPYFYEEAGRFKILLVDHQPDISHLRLTVDTPEDMRLAREIYSHFKNSDDFTLAEIQRLLKQRPDLLAINAAVVHKNYKDVDERS